LALPPFGAALGARIIRKVVWFASAIFARGGRTRRGVCLCTCQRRRAGPSIGIRRILG